MFSSEEVKATRLPWRLEQGKILDSEGVETVSLDLPPEQAEVVARYIVDAVNAYRPIMRDYWWRMG